MRYRILDMFWLNCNNGVRPFHVLAKWMKGVLCRGKRRRFDLKRG